MNRHTVAWLAVTSVLTAALITFALHGLQRPPIVPPPESPHQAVRPAACPLGDRPYRVTATDPAALRYASPEGLTAEGRRIIELSRRLPDLRERLIAQGIDVGPGGLSHLTAIRDLAEKDPNTAWRVVLTPPPAPR